MPSRSTPRNWRVRTIALLREASVCGAVVRAAVKLGEKRPQLIEETIQLVEALELKLFASGEYVSYNNSCRVAAERLEGE